MPLCIFYSVEDDPYASSTMSRASDGDELQRAHVLSSQASILLKPSQPLPVNVLQSAAQAYTEAADLFARSATTTTDEGAKRTLDLLTNQHRKLARDVERRILVAQNAPSATTGAGAKSSSPVAGGAGTGTASEGGLESGRAASSGGGTSPPASGINAASGSLAARRLMSEGVAGGQGVPTGSLGSRFNTAMGVPPFALRPSNQPSNPGAASGPSRLASTPSLQRHSPAPTGTSPHSPTRSSYSQAQRPAPGGGNTSYDSYSHTLSPLVSSSSSDESYLNLGAIPDTLDPFSRFWGMLDNMLDNISNPVAFATAQVDLDADLDANAEAERGYEEIKRPERGSKQEETPSPARQRKVSYREIDRKSSSSPTESFYVVPSNKQVESTRASGSRQSSPTLKTPEELALENTSLRASLDALAIHTQALEKQNKSLKAQHEGRERLMRNAVAGVRREANKAKHGQELMRSQLLASVSIPSAKSSPKDTQEEAEGSSSTQAARIRELEAQVQALKLDNEKKQAQIEKYKDRFERIKANARAKKDAKTKLEGSNSGNNGKGAEGDLDEPG